MNAMKFCGATAFLNGNKWNEYNEGLWYHNIVGWDRQTDNIRLFRPLNDYKNFTKYNYRS